MTNSQILLGCNGRGAQRSSLTHPIGLAEPSLREQFRMVKEAGVFDYFDRLPLRENLDESLALIEEFNLPIHTGSWFYRIGRDDALLKDNMHICQEVGAACHNIMVFDRHEDGHWLSDDEVEALYLDIYELGISLGVEPSFELHVDMWSEQFMRVATIAERVRKHGIPFNFTLDYSHVVFKMGNPQELERSGVRELVENGLLRLDPFEDNSLCDQWLGMNMTRWLQLRSVCPNQGPNLWHRDAQGQYPRGIQYPFVRPQEGEWHSPWQAYLLEPSKQAVRKALRHHVSDPESRLRYITTEMINLPDYGLGAKYDLFEHNVAAARFIRSAHAEALALHSAGLLQAHA